MEKDNQFKIGSRIKTLRMKTGLSAKEFASKIGIPYSTYSNYENNNREPSFEAITEITNALGVSIDTLLGFSYKENELDTNDLLSFYSSLGYIVRQIDDMHYNLISRDIADPGKFIVTWDELKDIKKTVWKYLRFTIHDRYD